KGVGDRTDEHVACEWIDRPRLVRSTVWARTARDVAGEGPHGGVRSECADERNAVANGRIRRSEEGKRSTHAGPEQPAPRGIYIRSLQQVVVCGGDVLDIFRHEPAIS